MSPSGSTCCPSRRSSVWDKSPKDCTEAARRFRRWLLDEHSLPAQSAKEYSEAFHALLEKQGRTEGLGDTWMGVLMNASDFLTAFLQLPDFKELGNRSPHRERRRPGAGPARGGAHGATAATTPKPKQARALSTSADSTEEAGGEEALTPEAVQQVARPFQNGASIDAEAEVGPKQSRSRPKRSSSDDDDSPQVPKRLQTARQGEWLQCYGATRTATSESVDAATSRKEQLDGVAQAKEALLHARREALNAARDVFMSDNLALQAAHQRLEEEEEEASRTMSSSSKAAPETPAPGTAAHGSSYKVQSKLPFANKTNKSAFAVAAAATPQRSRSSRSVAPGFVAAAPLPSAAEALSSARAKQAASAAALREADMSLLIAQAAFEEASDAAFEAARELAQTQALLVLTGKATTSVPSASAEEQ